MKVAISMDKNKKDVDQRFGRCAYFAIVDEDIRFIENKGALEGHGAGTIAAKLVAEEGAEAVITGNLGPNAAKILEQFQITAYKGSGDIDKAMADFREGRLEKIDEIAVPGHKEPDRPAKERIFFPLLDDNGMGSEISQHFGHAPFFGVYDVGEKKLDVISNDLDHTDPDKSPIDQIEEAVHPTTIFAKGIGGRAIQIIREKGLCLKTGDFGTVGEAIENIDSMTDQTKSCGHEH